MPSKALFLSKLARDVNTAGDLTSAGIVSGALGGGGATVYDSIGLLPYTDNTTGDQAYVQTNNRFYIWDSTGWFNVALVNRAPTITSLTFGDTWNTSGSNYYFDSSSDTNYTITINAVDSDDNPSNLTYSQIANSTFDSYASLSFTNNIATVTLTDSDFNTTVSDLTFRVSDGISFDTIVASNIIMTRTNPPNYESVPSGAYGLNSTALTVGSQSTTISNGFTDGSTNIDIWLHDGGTYTVSRESVQLTGGSGTNYNGVTVLHTGSPDEAFAIGGRLSGSAYLTDTTRMQSGSVYDEQMAIEFWYKFDGVKGTRNKWFGNGNGTGDGLYFTRDTDTYSYNAAGSFGGGDAGPQITHTDYDEWQHVLMYIWGNGSSISIEYFNNGVCANDTEAENLDTFFRSTWTDTTRRFTFGGDDAFNSFEPMKFAGICVRYNNPLYHANWTDKTTFTPLLRQSS